MHNNVMVPSDDNSVPHDTPASSPPDDDQAPDPISHLNAALGEICGDDVPGSGGLAGELDRIRAEMDEVLQLSQQGTIGTPPDHGRDDHFESSLTNRHRTLGDVMRWGRTHLVALARAQGSELRLEMDTWLELLPSGGVLSVMLERVRQALNDDENIPTHIEIQVNHVASGQVRICVRMRGHRAMDAMLARRPDAPIRDDDTDSRLPTWYRLVQSKGGTVLLRDATTDTPCLEACYPVNVAAPRGRRAG